MMAAQRPSVTRLIETALRRARLMALDRGVVLRRFRRVHDWPSEAEMDEGVRLGPEWLAVSADDRHFMTVYLTVDESEASDLRQQGSLVEVIGGRAFAFGGSVPRLEAVR